MGTLLHNYKEVRKYLDKEHPDWLRALAPRHFNAPADYWPQKVLVVSSANAAMHNYVSIHEQQTVLPKRVYCDAKRGRSRDLAALLGIEAIECQ